MVFVPADNSVDEVVIAPEIKKIFIVNILLRGRSQTFIGRSIQNLYREGASKTFIGTRDPGMNEKPPRIT